MAYPTSIPSNTDPTASNKLSSPSHSQLHQSHNAEIVAIETKIGTSSSTPTANTLLKGTGTGTSAWGTLTSAVLAATVTDETGSGSLVFGTSPTIATPAISNPTITSGGSWAGSPTITTPTVASFTNAQHNHTNAAGGGQLTGSTALTNSSVTADKLSTGAANATVATAETTTSTSYVDLATSGPAVTVTIGANGLALVIVTADLTNSGGNGISRMSFAVSGATTQASSNDFSTAYWAVTTSATNRQSGMFLLTGLAAGSTTFKAQYDVSANTGTFANRRISVVPL